VYIKGHIIAETQKCTAVNNNQKEITGIQ